MNISALLRRKVAGVPVVYFAALFVAILVFIAWRLKNVSGDATETTPDGDVEGDVADGGGTGGEDPNPVFISKPVPNTPGTDGVIVGTQDSNELWSRRAVEWLYGQHLATPAEAQAAIEAYMSGSDLSYGKSALVDKAIRQFGLPPEPLQRGKTLPSSAPAKRQGNPPVRHTVKGTNDNTFAELAQLYYGSHSPDHLNFLEVANISLEPKGTFAVGTQIVIPKYHEPKYYTANAQARTAAKIAAKNGTSSAAIYALNDAIARQLQTGVAIGTRVRVA